VNLLLTNSTALYAGGEEYVLVLARHLAERGHHLWVSALPGHLLLKKCAERAIPTIPLDYRGMSRVFAVSGELRRHLRRLAIDVIHSNANYDRTCAALASVGLPTRHVSGVHSAHSIQHNITHWWRNRWGTDQFITDADAGREVLIREDRISPTRITTVPIGVERQSPEFNRAARRLIRQEWAVGDSTVVVGNVARLVPFKGHRYLLEAIALVVRSSPNTLFVLVGDGELQESLKHQTRDLQIEHFVRFLGFQDRLDAIYPGFDVYCHSSIELAAEMFPLAVLRALGVGLPVVCTDVGGIAAMVRPGRSGMLTPPEDPHALAEALRTLLGDPARRRAMGAESLALFLERYHAPTMAAAVEKVYEQAVNSPRGRIRSWK
jgi:glycosyltransferase involved in cell wall biosynthesis